MAADSKQLVLQALDDLFNARRLERIHRAYTTRCELRSPDGIFNGHDGLRTFFERYLSAFPDSRVDLKYAVAEEDAVVVHYLFEGTHSGPLSFMGPTGCVVQVPGIVVSRIAGRRIVHQEFFWDNLAVRRHISLAAAAARSLRSRFGSETETTSGSGKAITLP